MRLQGGGGRAVRFGSPKTSCFDVAQCNCPVCDLRFLVVFLEVVEWLGFHVNRAGPLLGFLSAQTTHWPRSQRPVFGVSEPFVPFKGTSKKVAIVSIVNDCTFYEKSSPCAWPCSLGEKGAQECRGTFPILCRDPSFRQTSGNPGENGSGFWKEPWLKRMEQELTP